MGNLVSQCVSGGGGAGPVVVGPDGGVLRFEELAVAGVAELMIEAPGHVVACARDVRRGRRVRALGADELLRPGEVYLLVPAARAGARLGDREVEAVGRLVSRRKGGKGCSRRIFPEAEAGAEEDDVGGVEGEKGIGYAAYAAYAGTPAAAAAAAALAHGIRPRQWRPALHTICEA